MTDVMKDSSKIETRDPHTPPESSRHYSDKQGVEDTPASRPLTQPQVFEP